MAAMSAPSPVPSAGRRGRGLVWLILVLALLGAAAVVGWRVWTRYDADQRAEVIGTDQRLEALDTRIDTLRRDQRALTQRLRQAEATNRVLRDELLGIGQRAALLEDTVAKLADPDRQGAQALRLDQAELLLGMGLERVQIAGDIPGALRAYALAAGVLDGVADPAYLSLRQTLMQERAALEQQAQTPRLRALTELDAFAREVTAPGGVQTQLQTDSRPWWRRAFGDLFDVRPTDRGVARDDADRAAAYAGLQLELTLARAAAERNDAAGFRSALRRAGQWLERLGADAAHRQRLQALAERPFALDVATLGSTLDQLRRMRAAR